MCGVVVWASDKAKADARRGGASVAWRVEPGSGLLVERHVSPPVDESVLRAALGNLAADGMVLSWHASGTNSA